MLDSIKLTVLMTPHIYFVIDSKYPLHDIWL